MRTRLPLVLGSLLLLAIPAARAQWRPNATGAAWDSRPDRLSVDGLAVASVNGSGLVLASLDGGVTATLSSRTSIPHNVDQVAVGAGVFYANTSSYRADTPGTGLYRSADGGATWTNVSAGLAAAFGNPTFSIFGVGVDGAAVYASVDNRLGIPSTKALYRSLDGGASWSRMALQPGFMGFTRLFRQGGALYVFARDGVITTLWRSPDDGATWTEITPSALRNISGAADPVPLDVYGTSDAASGALYIGGRIVYPASAPSYDGHPLYRSVDGGATWTRLYTALEGPGGPRPLSPVRIQSLAVVGNVLAATVGSRTSESQHVESGLWLSADDGLTWQRTVRTNNGVRYEYASQMNTLALAANVGGLLYTNEGTAAPSALVATPDPFVLATTTDSLRATLSGVRIRAGALLASFAPGRDTLFVRRNVAGNAPLTGVSDPLSGRTVGPFPPFPSMMADTWSLTMTAGAVTAYLPFSNPVYDFPFDPSRVPNPAALVLLQRFGSGWQRITMGVTVQNGFVRYAQSRASLRGDYTLGSTDPANTFGPAITAAEPGASASGLALRLIGASPVRGAARFDVTLGAPGPATLEVFDALGRSVARLDVAAGPNVLDASRFAPGMYAARLTSGGQAATRAFVVAR